MTIHRLISRRAALASSALALLALGTAAAAAPAVRHSDALYRGTGLRRGTGPGFSGSVTTTTGTGTTTTTGTTTGTGTTTTGTGTGTTTTTGPGGSGGGCPGGQGGPGGDRGPGGGRGGLLVSGTIASVDTTVGTITVTPAGGGTASVLAVTSSTVLVGHQTIAASAIALGDRLEVIGLPLTIQASAITVDHLTTSTTSGSESSSGGASSGSGPAPAPGLLRVIGVVSALSPPTLTVDNNFSVALSLTSGTTFAEVLCVTLSQMTAGESVRAQVTGGGTGTLTATFVDVTAASS